MREIVFVIEQTNDGGFTARAVGESIFTEADSFDVLKCHIVEAVEAHFDPGQLPVRVRFQFGHVRTLSLLGYLAAIYAWLCELSVISLHLFMKQKIDSIGHAALLTTMTFFTVFAWHRRDDFRSLRASGGRIPLTAGQMLLVSTFAIALGGLVAWIGARIFGH